MTRRAYLYANQRSAKEEYTRLEAIGRANRDLRVTASNLVLMASDKRTFAIIALVGPDAADPRLAVCLGSPCDLTPGTWASLEARRAALQAHADPSGWRAAHYDPGVVVHVERTGRQEH